MTSLVDVVVVSYNSASTLRRCVEPLAGAGVVAALIVVDNASSDDSLATLDGNGATLVPLARNRGFAHACNRGAELGAAPYVLFLNPDARIDPAGLQRLAAVLDERATAGLAAPRIVDGNGALEWSQRRFARLRSTYAQALFLHRLVPSAAWADEVVRSRAAYERPGAPEWVSGACMLVRRRALEAIGGWDEGFFLYGEDEDLCRRLCTAGYEIRFEPGAEATHLGGASAPRATLLPTLARSRIRYAAKHHGPAAAAAERLGVGIGALTHAIATPRGRAWRIGQLRAASVAFRPHSPFG